MSDGAINNIIKNAFEIDSDVIINKKGTNERTKREVHLNHGFHKFFETTAFNNGMSVLYVRRLLGQKSGLENSYFKPTWKDLLEGNNKVAGSLSIVDDLTINKENKLRRENTKLKEEQKLINRQLASVVSRLDRIGA